MNKMQMSKEEEDTCNLYRENVLPVIVEPVVSKEGQGELES